MSLPGLLNIDIYGGDTFSRSLALKDSASAVIDLTGWGFLAQIRRSSGGTVEATFDIIVTDAPNGALTITLPPATTAALASGTYMWDLQSTDAAGVVQTLLRGTATVTADVSEV